MADPNLNRELQALLNAMVNSASLLYSSHSLEFKIGALFILAYIAYRAGRSTVTDPLDRNVKNITEAIKNRQHYTRHIPLKIQRLARSRKIMMSIFLVISLAMAALYYLQHELLTQRNDMQRYAVVAILLLLLMASFSMWIYEGVLGFIAKKGGFNDQLIQQKLQGIISSLGKKTEMLLKGHLCKQLYLKKRKQTPLTTECVKEKCKKYRLLLKRRAQEIARMVENVLNFEWCSVCRKRLPFDELLHFQNRVYQKDLNSTQQKEASERNQYLFLELERMLRWVQDAGPCNCSRRYWLDSTKQIREFKKQEKIISQELAQFQQAKPNSK